MFLSSNTRRSNKNLTKNIQHNDHNSSFISKSHTFLILWIKTKKRSSTTSILLYEQHIRRALKEKNENNENGNAVRILTKVYEGQSKSLESWIILEIGTQFFGEGNVDNHRIRSFPSKVSSGDFWSFRVNSNDWRKSLATVERWTSRFRDGNSTVEDAPRSGRPVTVTDESVVE